MIIIDYIDRTLKGYCKKKDFKKQIEKLKGGINGIYKRR